VELSRSNNSAAISLGVEGKPMLNCQENIIPVYLSVPQES